MMPLYFAQVREDNRVEREIARRFNSKNMVCIGSGGCTAFSLLGGQTENIRAIDHNPAQIWLIELKRAAIMMLDREDFLRFIGVKQDQKRKQIFDMLSHLLTDEAKRYWIDNMHLVVMGINNCGVTESFYKLISSSILEHVYDRAVWEKLFSCTSLQEQHVFFETYFTRPEWITAISILLGKPMHLQFFPSFLLSDDQSKQPAAFFLKKFKEEILTKPVCDNYFLSQFMLGEYLDSPDGMPYYMTEKGFIQAKENMEKLTLVIGGIDEGCKGLSSIDTFMFSNVFDWITREQCISTMAAVTSCRSDSASLCIRNMFGTPDISVFNEFSKEEALSQTLLGMERSMMYNHVSLFTV